MWNPSTYSCECDRYCERGQYLDYKNCVCRKKIIDDLIEQCTSIVDTKNNTLSKKSDESSSNIYFIYRILVLFILFLVVFIYYWRKDNTKKITKKMHDVVYSSTGTLNY